MDNGHHKKYLKLANNLGITITDLGLFGIKNISELRKKYTQDEHLNNIRLSKFDSLWIGARPFVSQKLREMGNSWALFQGACIYKALLIQILIDNKLI